MYIQPKEIDALKFLQHSFVIGCLILTSAKAYGPFPHNNQSNNVSQSQATVQNALAQKMFYFVRSGQTDWDRQGLIIGQKDIPLNAKGVQQAEEMGNILKGYNIKTICHSPLVRTRQTAQIIAKITGAVLIEVEELKEKNSGVLEGGGYTQEATDEWYKRFLPEGAESWDDFNQRTMRGVNKCLQQEGSVLIVGHGGTYSSLNQIIGNGVQDISNCIPVRFNPPKTAQGTWLIDWVHEVLPKTS